MGLLIPRKQWRIKSAWEDYWETYARSDKNSLYIDRTYLPATPLLGYGFAKEAFLAGLQGKCRILFLGNGISLEPLDYYFSGCNVTVVDISEKACEIFENILKDVSRNVHDFLCDESSSHIRSRKSDNEEVETQNQFVYRPGGSIEIISADMFDWQPQAKWNYIHNKLAFLAFTEEEQELLLFRYYSWLENSGHLQISYYSSRQNPFKRIVTVANKIGFLVKDENIKDVFQKLKAYRDNPSEYRKIWLEYEFLEREKEALVNYQNAKMLRVIWSSVL